MSDDFFDSLIKIRNQRNDTDHDNYRKNGGFLNQYSVSLTSQSASAEASSSLLNVVERVPRLLFLFQGLKIKIKVSLISSNHFFMFFYFIF